MRLIDPTPEILLIVGAAVIGACLTYDPPDEPVPTVEIRWCDQHGWSGMLDGKCMAFTIDPIPLPSAGTCPGAYELWTYDPKKPAISVEPT